MHCFVFDLETTGLDHRHHKITELSLLNIEENVIFSRMIHPEQDLTVKAMEITGKSLIDFQYCQPFHSHVDDILEFVGDRPNTFLIGHNIDNFDKPFLKKEFERAGRTLPTSWKFIDTLKVSRLLFPHFPKHTQSSLCEYFKISNTNAHSAAKDVMDLQLIFRKLVENSSVEKLYRLSQEYQLWPCFEYRGVPMNQIPLWYLKKMKRQEFFEHNPDVLAMLQRSSRSDLCFIDT